MAVAVVVFFGVVRWGRERSYIVRARFIGNSSRNAVKSSCSYVLGETRPAAHASSFLTFLFPLFAFPSAGAIDKVVLPDGMQSVDFSYCEGLTGTAELGYE